MQNPTTPRPSSNQQCCIGAGSLNEEILDFWATEAGQAANKWWNTASNKQPMEGCGLKGWQREKYLKTDRQTVRKRGGPKDLGRETDRETQKETEGEMKEINREKDNKRKQKDWKTERQIDTERSRGTEERDRPRERQSDSNRKQKEIEKEIIFSAFCWHQINVCLLLLPKRDWLERRRRRSRVVGRRSKFLSMKGDRNVRQQLERSENESKSESRRRRRRRRRSNERPRFAAVQDTEATTSGPRKEIVEYEDGAIERRTTGRTERLTMKGWR